MRGKTMAILVAKCEKDLLVVCCFLYSIPRSHFVGIFRAHEPFSVFAHYWEKLKYIFFIELDVDEKRFPKEVLVQVVSLFFRELFNSRHAVMIPEPVYIEPPSLFDRLAENLRFWESGKEETKKDVKKTNEDNEEKLGDAFERKINEMSASVQQFFQGLGGMLRICFAWFSLLEKWKT
jgi:hypothetical protein